jgi:CRISPR-associated protein Csh2
MTIENRMEILFVYETKDCNPNGDPLDENKPRTDPDTGQVLVTDVRIKRTIRDYLFYAKGRDILVRDTFDEKGFLRDGKGRAESFEKAAGLTNGDNLAQTIEKLEKYILGEFIDARLFGVTLPVTPPSERNKGKNAKEGSVQITGPVQFSGFSRSLHRVDPMFVQGTAAYASQEGSMQKSFREDYICPYACIATYGIINEIAAETSKLTAEDVSELIEALWYGTASLISRSKVGHQPLFLLRIQYADRRQIGDLAGKISLASNIEHEKIRDRSQYRIDATRLVDAMNANAKFIASVDTFQDPSLQFEVRGTTGTFNELASDLSPRSLW